MHAEEISAIGPNATREPSRRAGDILKLADRIFVGVLGMDGFAGRKSKPQVPDSHRLIPITENAHLDAALAGIVNRLVAEAIEIERAFELADAAFAFCRDSSASCIRPDEANSSPRRR